ncbi:MAG TPA: class I SAM-dependent methyltransferase [Vicinamibacterales bacterium]|nr:class I SAM-dependent methyltransferase [Vicinamibacterales bacterium]
MLSDLLRRGARRSDPAAAPPPPIAPEADRDALVASRALPRFLAALAGRPEATLLDVGPAVGSNIAFFGERFACKLHVEDLYADVERHARSGTLADLPAALAARVRHADASVDGILCWDLFDYLDRASAQALARELVRILRPGGALFGLFATIASEHAQYTRFVIVDDAHLRRRPYPATPGRRQILQNRDIIKLFDGLIVSDSYLLLTNTREIVFRKRG